MQQFPGNNIDFMLDLYATTSSRDNFQENSQHFVSIAANYLVFFREIFVFFNAKNISGIFVFLKGPI
jgi:hypothetical protein